MSIAPKSVRASDMQFQLVNLKRGDDPVPRPCFEIFCSRCAAHEAVSAPHGRLPPPAVAQLFEHRKWRVRKGGHVCPACLRFERQEKKEARAEKAAGKPSGQSQEEVMPDLKTALAGLNLSAPEGLPVGEVSAAEISAQASKVPTPAGISAQASHAIVDLYMMLDDVYDKAGKCYRKGKSDAAIARDLGLVEAVVRERRERDFWPLVEDTTLEDLTALYADLVRLSQALDDHNKRLQAQFDQAMERQEALSAALDKIKADFLSLKTKVFEQKGQG